MLAYVNAKSKILEYIKNNSLNIGDRLPPETELAELLNVGRLSLREGLNALKSEGIILSVQGRGTFIACNIEHISDSLNMNYSVTDMIRTSGYAPGVSFFSKELAMAPVQATRFLRVDNDSDVPLCIRVRTADGVPVVVTRDYLSPELATIFLGLNEGEMSLYEFIEKNSERIIGTSVTEITVVCADEKMAACLDIPTGTPLIVLNAGVNDIYGNPLIFAEEFFRPDKFRFLVTRGRS